MNDDELSRKIQQIAGLLGQENMPDNVKGLLSVLSGALTDNESTEAETGHTRDEEPSGPAVKEDNAEFVRHAKSLMDKLNVGNDPRVNLLYALKPYMNNRRQQKIGNCIRLLQLLSLTKMIDFNDKPVGRD